MKPLVNAPLIREHALARGMVAGYVFNEGSGRRINDATGQAPGVFSSAVTKSSVSGWQGSKQGGGLAFNGATEYAQLPEWPFDFERTQPFAFAFRAKFANVSEVAHPVYSKIVNGGTFRGVGISAFNGVSLSNAVCLQLISTFSSNTLQVTTPAGSIAAETWYDVVVNYDGSSTPGGCFITINGVPQTLSTTYNSLSATILNDVAPWIGARADQVLPPRCTLDYLYIYRRTIGRSEAKAFRADPYQMFDRSQASGIWVPSTYGQNLILDAEAGAFTVSGQDANLTPALLLDAEAGQFTVTGQDADLIPDLLISAETGQFVMVGQDASLIVQNAGQGEGGGTLKKNPRIGRTNRRPQIANIEYDRDTRQDAFTVLLCS